MTELERRYTDIGEPVEQPWRLSDRNFLLLAAQEIVVEGDMHGKAARHPTTEWTRHVLKALVTELRAGGARR